jgi:hypothetical protein
MVEQRTVLLQIVVKNRFNNQEPVIIAIQDTFLKEFQEGEKQNKIKFWAQVNKKLKSKRR